MCSGPPRLDRAAVINFKPSSSLLTGLICCVFKLIADGGLAFPEVVPRRPA